MFIDYPSLLNSSNFSLPSGVLLPSELLQSSSFLLESQVFFLSSGFFLQFSPHDHELILKHSVFGEHYLYLIGHFRYQSFEIPEIVLAHLFYLAYFVLSFCHLQLQGIDCLSRLKQLAPQQSILIQKLPIQPLLLFVHSLVIRRKLFVDGLPARVEHSALWRKLSAGNFQAFL